MVFGRNILDRFGDLFGWGRRNEPALPTDEQIGMIAKDAVRESGAAEFLKAVAAAKSPEERQKLRASWENKIAERRVHFLADDVSTTPGG